MKYARDYGMEHYSVQINNSDPNNIVVTVKGTKRISTSSGEVFMGILGEVLYGRHSAFTLLVGAPVDKLDELLAAKTVTIQTRGERSLATPPRRRSGPFARAN